MQKSIKHFLRAVLALMLFLFIMSIVYVGKDRGELDEDSMLLAMLLMSFSGIASLIVGIVLIIMNRQK